MYGLTPRSTLTDTPFPHTTLFRSTCGQQASRLEPAEHLFIRKAEPRVRVTRAQFLDIVRREIGDQQAPARHQHARRLTDRRPRLLREMEHMVQDRRVRRAVAPRQRVEIGLAPFGITPPPPADLRARDPPPSPQPTDP